MYTILCLIGAAGSLVVLAGCLATLWFGLRTVITGLFAGQPDVVRWVIVFAVGLIAAIGSLVVLSICDHRRQCLTMTWDPDKGKWVPVSRSKLA